MKRGRRRKKINVQPKHFLLVGVIFCCILIFVSFRYEEQIKPVKIVFGNLISPMQRGINVIGSNISNYFKQLESIEQLQEENARLQQQVEQLTDTNKILTMDKYELDGLRRLYELDEKYTEYEKVAARIIAREPSSWYDIFWIDKGSDQGIAVDMNVMADGGLVGIVTEVGTNWAKVRAIIDDDSNVSGMSLKSQDTCIVSGDLRLMKEGVIRVEMISMDASLQEQDEIVTSHISDKYLQGILIGYVTDIVIDVNNMTKTAYLIPAVDFAHLEEVLIITELKQTYDFTIE